MQYDTWRLSESKPTLVTSSGSSGSNRSAPANSLLAGTTPGKDFKTNNDRALADILYIYPNKRKKNSFENKREEILRNGLQAAIGGGRNNDGKLGKNFDSAGKTEMSDEKFMKSKRLIAIVM